MGMTNTVRLMPLRLGAVFQLCYNVGGKPEGTQVLDVYPRERVWRRQTMDRNLTRSTIRSSDSA